PGAVAARPAGGLDAVRAADADPAGADPALAVGAARTLPAARAARARVGPAAVDVGLAVVRDGVGAGRGLTDVGRADAVLTVAGVAARLAVGAARAQVHAAAIDVGLGAVGEAVAAGRLREADAPLARTALAVAVAGAGLPR